ncbi:hypothetical protein PLESTB_000736200 [Pleodorina starrii]|uniref:Coenzyme Q-binding protein COQ10 START domain-containing protein n=1 Tax=Pleodorina starrii TaxID=330485 RepID=A0A9W6BJN2_9CHLO|nr:hypothetical protein PLESTM_000188100 [Pleodorina starrii]GLC53359.1 hypothetical protein PLESTB_000736200 [Pleodorina starrii]GLC67171.1 hypothetical protein PLESTF_000525000 [Pleodorina starrii]
MTGRKGLLSAASVARCAVRALECRQSAASSAILTSSSIAPLWTATEAAQQSGKLLIDARDLSHKQASTSARNFFTMGSPMPSKVYNQRRLVGWAPEQLYAVVSRVEDYHKFVPWCQRSTIVKPPVNNYMEAELEVGFQVLVERYTSQVFLTPPRSVRSRVADSSLFDHLDSTWTMEPGPTPRTCWLSFSVDFAFRSQLHGNLADIFFSEVVKQMSGAFEGRCARLYGPSSLLAPAAARPAAAAAPPPKSQVSVAVGSAPRGGHVGHGGRAHGTGLGQGASHVHRPAPTPAAGAGQAVEGAPAAEREGAGQAGSSAGGSAVKPVTER